MNKPLRYKVYIHSIHGTNYFFIKDNFNEANIGIKLLYDGAKQDFIKMYNEPDAETFVRYLNQIEDYKNPNE